MTEELTMEDIIPEELTVGDIIPDGGAQLTMKDIIPDSGTQLLMKHIMGDSGTQLRAVASSLRGGISCWFDSHRFGGMFFSLGSVPFPKLTVKASMSSLKWCLKTRSAGWCASHSRNGVIFRNTAPCHTLQR